MPNSRPIEIHTADSMAASRVEMTWAERWTSSRSASSSTTMPARSATQAQSGTSSSTNVPGGVSAASRTASTGTWETSETTRWMSPKVSPTRRPHARAGAVVTNVRTASLPRDTPLATPEVSPVEPGSEPAPVEPAPVEHAPVEHAPVEHASVLDDVQAAGSGRVVVVVDEDDVVAGSGEQAGRDAGAVAAGTVDPQLAAGSSSSRSASSWMGTWSDPRMWLSARSSSRRTSRTVTSVRAGCQPRSRRLGSCAVPWSGAQVGRLHRRRRQQGDRSRCARVGAGLRPPGRPCRRAASPACPTASANPGRW